MADRRYDHVLFDLDGTITDSAPGITRSVQQGMRAVGIDIADLERLKVCIGPPLHYAFTKEFHMPEEDVAPAVAAFRARYEAVGIYENALYSGIAELLRDMRAAGYTVMLSSSKPHQFIHAILSHFGVEQYFDIAEGTRADETRKRPAGMSDKAVVVEHTLELLADRIDPGIKGSSEKMAALRARCVMVGDRCFDIEGALANGIDSIGVLYGYGTRKELAEAGCVRICETVGDLRALFLGEGTGA